MGGGASRRQPTAAQGQKKLLEATGPKGDPSRDPPALQRRRRVLFGPDSVKSKTQFEGVAPRHQFQAAVSPEDHVFRRVGEQEVQSLRRRAEGTQHSPADGYLRENAIELLELGLQKGNRLATRLFQIAQVQRVAGNRMRRPMMTCYELLALFSVLRFGEDSDLLELLFCLFDADADDRLSVEDMTLCIFAFLDWTESEAALERKEQEEFSKFDKYKEARRLAELAVKEFGTTQEAGPSAAGLGEDASSGDEIVSAIAPKPGTTLDEESTKSAPDKASKDLDGSDSEKGPSPSSSKVDADSPAAPKTSREAGKPLLDSDSENEKSAKAKSKTKAKPKARSAKAKAKSRKSCCFCGPGGKRNSISRLTFAAWKRWLMTAQLLPPEFESLLASEIAAEEASEAHKLVQPSASLLDTKSDPAMTKGSSIPEQGLEGMAPVASGTENKEDLPPLPTKSTPSDRPGHTGQRPAPIVSDLDPPDSD